MSEVFNGRVAKVFPERNYAWIVRTSDGGYFFAHRRNWKAAIQSEDLVCFSVGEFKGKPTALNVCLRNEVETNVQPIACTA